MEMAERALDQFLDDAGAVIEQSLARKPIVPGSHLSRQFGQPTFRETGRSQEIVDESVRRGCDLGSAGIGLATVHDVDSTHFVKHPAAFGRGIAGLTLKIDRYAHGQAHRAALHDGVELMRLLYSVEQCDHFAAVSQQAAVGRNRQHDAPLLVAPFTEGIGDQRLHGRSDVSFPAEHNNIGVSLIGDDGEIAARVIDLASEHEGQNGNRNEETYPDDCVSASLHGALFS